jgi:phosphohistidine phosphatase SixA
MVKTQKKRGGFSANPFNWFKSIPTSPTNVQPIQSQVEQPQTQLQGEELQDQAQSSNTIAFQPPNQSEYNLLVSHNNRIQSWLDRLLKTTPYFKNIFDTKEKMRFSNCAAFSLVFDNTNVNIELLHPGDATSNKKEEKDFFRNIKQVYYWGISDDPSNNIVNFPKFDIPRSDFLSISNINDTKSIQHLIGKKFLIVRHGEATHNLKKRGMFDKDTLLTSKGIEQGAKLGNFLKESGFQINKECYVSDLIRTGMTAWAIGNELFGKSSFEKYVVVPCNTEVTNAKGDKGDWSKRRGYQNENKTDCNFTKSCLTAEPIPNCSLCSRCFYIDQYGTPKKCPLDKNGLIQESYKSLAIDLTPKYEFAVYMDFIRQGKKCSDDLFQQLNIVFRPLSKNANQPINNSTETITAPNTTVEGIATIVQQNTQPNTEQNHSFVGGSNYKRTKKMKKGKKFTKKGGKKNKVRKTSKTSKK